MKTPTTTKHWLALTAAASLSVASSYGGQLVNTIGSGKISQASGYTLGGVFTVGSNSLEVTSLGVYEATTGISSPIQVGLYNGNGTAGEDNAIPGAGNNLLIGEVTVPTTTNSSGQEGFQFVNLATPILLVAGQTYTIGAFYDNNQTYRDTNGSGFTFSSDFTSDFGAYSSSKGASLQEPNTNYNTAGTPDDTEVAPYVGPDLEYTVVGAPEPSTWALMGLGAVILAAARFRSANV